MIRDLILGDSVDLECQSGEDITGWKIRCEIWDTSHQIKKATANSGGADSQIEITEATQGVFVIKIAKGDTTDFDDQAQIEIEMETNDSPSKIYTVFQSVIQFTTEKIKWSTP